MISPNKAIAYQDSIISKLPFLIISIGDSKVSLSDVFLSVHNHFESINQFIIALDVLYMLDWITLDNTTGEIRHVSQHKL